MLHLIWSGNGWLVPVITFGLSLLGEVVVESLFKDDQYYQAQAWPLAIVLAAAASSIWVLGRRFNTANDRVLVDKVSGEEVVVRGDRHRFFFVRMEYWAILLGILSILRLLVLRS